MSCFEIGEFNSRLFAEFSTKYHSLSKFGDNGRNVPNNTMIEINTTPPPTEAPMMIIFLLSLLIGAEVSDRSLDETADSTCKSPVVKLGF